MDRTIPWDIDYENAHFFPPEEYKVSFVEVNPLTGKEEIIHHSRGYHDNDIYNSFFDSYIL